MRCIAFTNFPNTIVKRETRYTYDDNFANVTNKYLPADECKFYVSLVSAARFILS